MLVKPIANRIFTQHGKRTLNRSLKYAPKKASLTKTLTLMALFGAAVSSSPLIANNSRNIPQGKPQTELLMQNESQSDSITKALSTQISDKKQQIKEKKEQQKFDQIKQEKNNALKKQQAKQKLEIAKLEYELETGEDADKLVSWYGWILAGAFCIVGSMIGYLIGLTSMLRDVKKAIEEEDSEQN